MPPHRSHCVPTFVVYPNNYAVIAPRTSTPVGSSNTPIYTPSPQALTVTAGGSFTTSMTKPPGYPVAGIRTPVAYVCAANERRPGKRRTKYWIEYLGPLPAPSTTTRNLIRPTTLDSNDAYADDLKPYDPIKNYFLDEPLDGHPGLPLDDKDKTKNTNHYRFSNRVFATFLRIRLWHGT